MRPAAGAAAGALLLGLAGSAAANDTAAELGAGGLIYARSDEVSIESETLYISIDKVTVDYVFRNNAGRDVETIVAFPMPDIETGPDANISIPRFDDNFLGFSVEADGQAIRPDLQQRAWANGIDVTDILVKAGLPVSPLAYYDDGPDLASLPQDTLAELVEHGMVTAQYDPGEGKFVAPVDPAWSLKSAYWWRMTFPAGADVSVHHEYTPSVGGTVGVFFPDIAEIAADYEDRYCTDAGFVRAVRKRQEAAQARGEAGYTERWLSYVLTTGANWAGFIRHFRLIVDKGSEKNLVSFCGEGVEKTGPTTFEMEKTEFWPERDLDILFITAVDP
ncbi:MAG: DUF4424 domain-containing protein [Oricola sp.]